MYRVCKSKKVVKRPGGLVPLIVVEIFPEAKSVAWNCLPCTQVPTLYCYPVLLPYSHIPTLYCYPIPVCLPCTATLYP